MSSADRPSLACERPDDGFGLDGHSPFGIINRELIDLALHGA
jgi:hypothetical protein